MCYTVTRDPDTSGPRQNGGTKMKTIAQENHMASGDAIGEWNGREDYAARRWNNIVLPELEKLEMQFSDDERYGEKHDEVVDLLHYAAIDAWDKFCSPSGSRGAIAAIK